MNNCSVLILEQYINNKMRHQKTRHQNMRIAECVSFGIFLFLLSSIYIGETSSSIPLYLCTETRVILYLFIVLMFLFSFSVAADHRVMRDIFKDE